MGFYAMNFGIEHNTDAAAFFRRHDMLWTKMPRSWDQAPFIGSGLVGSLMYFNNKNRLTLTLGDTSVYDNRLPTPGEHNPMFLSPRLPLGHFILGGIARSCEMRLDLYNARVTGTSKTLLGACSFTCFAPHGKKLTVLEVQGDLNTFGPEWSPSPAVSPRQRFMLNRNKARASADYAPPKKPYSYQHRDVTFSIQPLFSGGYSITAYKIQPTEHGYRMIVATGQGSEESIVTSQLAFELDNAFLNFQALREKHERWWHDFYGRSFLSMNDAATEEFYWIQLYKLASAGCESGRIYDTCGPWLPEITAWPGTWWNLNLQLTYSPLLTSNHTELILPLAAELRRGFSELVENVPSEYRYDSAGLGRCTTATLHSPVPRPGDASATQENGNLLWALHTLWRCYKARQDTALMQSTLFPILKRAVSFYLHFLLLDDRGRLHIPATLSPEYPETGMDANYDLALLKWGLGALIETCERQQMNETSYEEWKWVAENLADYPTDENGFRIAADVPYGVSHRHYSHLLMLSPLQTLDLRDPQNADLARRSLEYWQSKPEALQGYSYTGAASMYALLGDGDRAYERLTKLWEGEFISPNTMYSEGGNPVLETPCAAAASILDMLLQSRDGRITILPAVPKLWTDVTFDRLLCEGGFEASAALRGGALLWAGVKNTASGDGVCEIEIPMFAGQEVLLCCEDFEKELLFPEQGLRLKIPEGQMVIFRSKTAQKIEIAPVSDDEKDCHVYGLNKNSMI